MTTGSSMLAMILTAPPQRWQVSMSIRNTRLRRCAQLMAARRGAGVLTTSLRVHRPRRPGVTCARSALFGANTP